MGANCNATFEDAYSLGMARPRNAGAWTLTAFVALGTFALAFDEGTYPLTSRNSVAILALWLVGVGIATGFWPRAQIPVPAVVVGGLLAAFALWTALSTFWADSNERSVNEANRAVLYLAVFAVVVLSPDRGRHARRWIRGLAIGISAIGFLALASRLFPQHFDSGSASIVRDLFPSVETRLSYPVGYWNALATFLALGVPLLLFVATTERRALARALAILPLPALAVALYLTSSRGGILAAVLAAAAYTALTSRRWHAVGAIVVAGVASVIAVGFVIARDAVIEGQQTGAIRSEGRSAAALILAACIGAAVVYAVGSRFRVGSVPLRRAIGWGLAAAATLVVVAAAFAAHPARRFEDFKAEPAKSASTDIQAHLASGSGNGRWQLWQAAVDQFEEHPLAGEGAGSYEAWWAANGSLGLFVRDAHSLYLETLGELGIVGFLLIVAALGTGLVFGILRAFRSEGDGRAAAAALSAALLAFLFEAGIDWMWETTAVTVVAMVCLGLLTGPATVYRRSERIRAADRGAWVGISARAAAVAVVLVLVAAQAVPLLAQSAVGQSEDAVGRGDGAEALKTAKAAERIQPWAASTHLQRALVEELSGNVPAALAAIRRALARESGDWRLWVVAARLETKAGEFESARESLDRAVALNPRSRILAQFAR